MAGHKLFDTVEDGPRAGDISEDQVLSENVGPQAAGTIRVAQQRLDL